MLNDENPTETSNPLVWVELLYLTEEETMLKRIIGFIRSRPTEVWLGLWAAIVAAVFGTEAPSWVAGVSAVIGWVITFIASRDSNSLGPQ